MEGEGKSGAATGPEYHESNLEGGTAGQGLPGCDTGKVGAEALCHLR